MKQPFPSEVAAKFMTRFPDGMRHQIAAAAKAAGRSMNAEIVLRLQQSLGQVASAASVLDPAVDLRDSFAIAAPPAPDDFGRKFDEESEQRIARWAYAYADAMLAARGRT